MSQLENYCEPRYSKLEQEVKNKKENKIMNEIVFQKLKDIGEIKECDTYLELFDDGSGVIKCTVDSAAEDDVLEFFDSLEDLHQELDKQIELLSEKDKDQEWRLSFIDWERYRRGDGSFDLVPIFIDYCECNDVQNEANIINKLRRIEKLQSIKSRQVAASILGSLDGVRLKNID